MGAVTDQPQSSSERLQVDTDKLTPAIAKLHDLSSRLKSAGTTLDMVCQSYGEPWGNDETGKKFHAQYEGPHSDLIAVAHQAGARLSSDADDVSNLVKALEDVESKAGEQGQQLSSSVGPGGEQSPPPAPNP